MAREAAGLSISIRSLLFRALLLTVGCQGYVRFCYYTNWSQYRTNGTNFRPSDIHPILCTHIVFAFAKLANNTISPIEDSDFALYREMNSLKKMNPRLKVLLAIGGWEADRTEFTRTVSSPANMNEFSRKALFYLKDHRFDGLDIDWEYPSGRGGPREDRARFTTLLQVLRAAFTEDSHLTKTPTMLLTAAVVGGSAQANAYYQIDQISKYLDYINIMTYDFHGSWETRTGIHCALYTEIDEALNSWIRAGAPPNKITMGISAFGRTFTLASNDPSPANFGLNQPVTGPGAPGPSTRASGSMAYYEICEMIKTLNWTEAYSASHSSPMAYGMYNGRMNWVGYDNVVSVREKARVIREKGLAGSMFWTLDQDDFQNKCGDNPYPLANALLEQLPSDGEVDGTTATWTNDVTTHNYERTSPGELDTTSTTPTTVTPLTVSRTTATEIITSSTEAATSEESTVATTKATTTTTADTSTQPIVITMTTTAEPVATTNAAKTTTVADTSTQPIAITMTTTAEPVATTNAAKTTTVADTGTQPIETTNASMTTTTAEPVATSHATTITTTAETVSPTLADTATVTPEKSTIQLTTTTTATTNTKVTKEHTDASPTSRNQGVRLYGVPFLCVLIILCISIINVM